jgi:phage shock protein C
MYCTKCGTDLREGSKFCSQCGQRIGAEVVESSTPRRLLLDKQNKKIAGVCAGFARYFEMDVVLMRVIWFCAALCTGVGFLAYLAAWMIIPSDAGIDLISAPKKDRRELSAGLQQTN